MMDAKTQAWIGVDAQQAEARQQDARYRQFIEQSHDNLLWELPPKELARQLQEVDPWLVQQLLSSGWEMLGGQSTNSSLERELAINASRWMYKNNPLYQFGIWLYTAWGLGDSISIEIVRPEPKSNTEAEIGEADIGPAVDPTSDAWQKCFTAPRNQAIFGDDRIQELSNETLKVGSLFLVAYSNNQDGETEWSALNFDEVTEIVTHPQNSMRPLFYKRQFTSGTKSLTWYYPDWQAYFSKKLDEPYPGDAEKRTLAEVVLPRGAIRADTQKAVGDTEMSEVTTPVCVLHIAYNIKEFSNLWGWPLATCARPYLEAQKKYVEAQLTVAMAKAAFVRRMTAQTGSRGIKGMIGTVASNLSASQYTDTNPAPTSGATQMVNKAVTVEDLPMTSGAGDAKVNNDMFSWLALLGMGLFPASAGLDTQKYATAVEMDKAQSMIFERYQTFWRAQFERIVQIVIGFKQEFGDLVPGDYTVEVSVDSFSLADFPAVGRAIGDVVSRTLTPLVDNGVLSTDAARAILAPLWRVNLQALGIKAAAELTSDEAFGIGEIPEDAEKPEPGPPAELPVEPTAIEKIAGEIGAGLALGDGALGEALAWAILTAQDALVE